MARPLKRRRYPKPSDVTLRTINGDATEVVAPDELARRKEEAEWQRYRRSHGEDLRDEHARLALRLHDVITVPAYTRDIWWFVRDVNGIERQITACSILFDMAIERTFTFEMVEISDDPFFMLHPGQRNEAAYYLRLALNQLGPAQAVSLSRASAA